VHKTIMDHIQKKIMKIIKKKIKEVEDTLYGQVLECVKENNYNNGIFVKVNKFIEEEQLNVLSNK